MKKALEKDILKSILSWLDLNKYTYWRNSIGPVMRGGGKAKLSFSPNPMRGFPDLAGIVPGSNGRLWTAEVKTKTGKLSEHQLLWQERLKSAGVVYFVPRSLDEMVSYLLDAEMDEGMMTAPSTGAILHGVRRDV